MGPNVFLYNDNVLDDCFIAIISVQNSMGAIHATVPSLMMHSGIEYVDRNDCQYEVKTVWEAMKISPSFLPLFMEVDPQWNLGTQRLEVSAALLDDLRGMEKISTCIYVCRSVMRWSLTRWARVGKTGCLLLRAVMTGLPRNVQEVFDDSTWSDTNLNGWKRCSSEVLLLLAAAALACKPTERFIIALLQDDRFLMRVEELRVTLEDDMRSVALFPDLVWRRVAVAAGCSAFEVKATTLYAMMRMHGFVWRETFAEVYEYPLKMSQGNIEANVVELRNNPNLAVDKVTRRWGEFLATGGSEAQLCCLLRLLKAVATTVTLVEQGHAAGAIVMKTHEQCSEKQLRVRALLRALRPVIRPNRNSAKLRGVRKRMKALDTIIRNKSNNNLAKQAQGACISR